MLETHVLITAPARSGSRLLTEPGFFYFEGIVVLQSKTYLVVDSYRQAK